MGACNRYTFEAVWISLQLFSCGVRLLIHYCGLDCFGPCRSVPVRRGPPRTNFFNMSYTVYITGNVGVALKAMARNGYFFNGDLKIWRIVAWKV